MAMYLVLSDKPIPVEWEHDPCIQDWTGSTVAMYMAYEGYEITQ